MAAGPEGGHAVGEVAVGRVRVDLGEHRAPEAGGGQDVEGGPRDRQPPHTAVGAQQRPGDAGGGTGLRKLRDPAGTEAQGGRGVRSEERGGGTEGGSEGGSWGG